MDSLLFILKFLLYLLVAAPLCTAFHEAGHAAMILLLTRQKATFQFGALGKRLEFHWGRLTVIVYLEPIGMSFCVYRLEDYAGLSFKQKLWMTLGGPIASLLGAILCVILNQASNGADPWTVLFLIFLLQFLNTSIPWNYARWQGVMAGRASDGRQVVELYRGARRASPAAN
jgi:hypothetical protein